MNIKRQLAGSLRAIQKRKFNLNFRIRGANCVGSLGEDEPVHGGEPRVIPLHDALPALDTWHVTCPGVPIKLPQRLHNYVSKTSTQTHNKVILLNLFSSKKYSYFLITWRFKIVQLCLFVVCYNCTRREVLWGKIHKTEVFWFNFKKNCAQSVEEVAQNQMTHVVCNSNKPSFTYIHVFLKLYCHNLLFSRTCVEYCTILFKVIDVIVFWQLFKIKSSHVDSRFYYNTNETL